MTIEELLEKPASELEKMTDKELDEYFKPYLVFCKAPPVVKTQQELSGISHSSKITSTIIPPPLKKQKTGSAKLNSAFYEEVKRKAAALGVKL